MSIKSGSDPGGSDSDSDGGITPLKKEDIDAIPFEFRGEEVLLYLENGTDVEETTEDDPIGIVTDTHVPVPYLPPKERERGEADDRQ